MFLRSCCRICSNYIFRWPLFYFLFVLILIVTCLIAAYFCVLQFRFRLVVIAVFASILITHFFAVYFFNTFYRSCSDWSCHFWWYGFFIFTSIFTFLRSFSWSCLIWWNSLFILSLRLSSYVFILSLRWLFFFFCPLDIMKLLKMLLKFTSRIMNTWINIFLRFCSINTSKI